MKNAYVTALTVSILSGMNVDKALSGVRAVLTEKGHLRLWPQILKASMRVLESKLKQSEPHVMVAKEGQISKAELEKALATLGVTDFSTVNIAVDETLVGGFTARFKGKLIEASHKKALLDLYNRIITK